MRARQTTSAELSLIRGCCPPCATTNREHYLCKLGKRRWSAHAIDNVQVRQLRSPDPAERQRHGSRSQAAGTPWSKPDSRPFVLPGCPTSAPTINPGSPPGPISKAHGDRDPQEDDVATVILFEIAERTSEQAAIPAHALLTLAPNPLVPEQPEQQIVLVFPGLELAASVPGQRRTISQISAATPTTNRATKVRIFARKAPSPTTTAVDR